MFAKVKKFFRVSYPNYYYRIISIKPIKKLIDSRDFHRFDKENAARRKAVQNYGYEVLTLIYNFGKDFDWPIRITDGTLLGLIREGKLIEHDYDVDFLTHLPDNEKRSALLQYLKENGCEHIRHVEISERVISDAFDYNGVFFDIDYIVKSNGQLYKYSFITTTETVVEEKNGTEYIIGAEIKKYDCVSDDCKEVAFENGTMCFAPAEMEKQVEAIYGPDWRVPIKNWNSDEMDTYNKIAFTKEFKMWKKR